MEFYRCVKTIGTYQYLILLTSAMQLLADMIISSGVLFTVPDLHFNCNDLDLVRNSADTLWENQCRKSDESNHNDSSLSLLVNGTRISHVFLCTNISYDHSQFTYTATEKYSLVCGRKWLTTLSGTSYMIGLFTGALSSGLLCDRYGRKVVIFLASLLGVGANLVGIFAPNYTVYLIVRGVLGFVVMLTWLPLATLLIELVRCEQRNIISQFDSCSYTASSAIIAAIVYVLSNYIHMHYLAIVLQCLVSVLTFTFLHESPKWLIVQNRQDEAHRVVEKIAKFNKIPKISLQYLLATEHEEIKKRANIFDLFRTPITRKRTLILLVIWLCIVFLAYAITYNMGEFSSDVRLSLIICGVIEAPSILLLILATNKFGRQVTLFAVVLASGGCCAVMGFFEKGSIVLMVLSIVGKVLMGSSFNLLYLYTPELYSTQIRITGLGLCSTVARIGSFLSPQVKLLNQFWDKSSVLLLASMSIIAAVCIPTLPDTTGYELPASLENAETFQADHTYALTLPVKRKARDVKSAEAITKTDGNVTEV